MNESIRVVVVDDHPLMAQATKQLLEQIEGIEVAAIAYDGKMGIDLVQEHSPVLVFLDYQLPDLSGSEMARSIISRHPQIRVVIFTGEEITDLVGSLLEIGVSGIISKETRAETIKHMVACVLDDHIVIPYSMVQRTGIARKTAAVTPPLTEQEIAIMQFVVQGSTIEQIAEHIHVSKRSVDNYLRKIYDKLNATSRTQAIEKFVQCKW